MSYEDLDKLMFNEPPADGVYSMDDPKLYGEVRSTHSYPEMVNRGYVVPTAIHILQTDGDVWDELEEDGDIRLRDEDTGEEIVLDSDGQKSLGAAMIAVRKWAADAVGSGIATKMLAFLSRITDCERAVDPAHILSLVRGDQHGIHCEVFHSGLSPRQRKRAKTTFANHKGPALMVSVRAIREGVSIDDADTIILLRGYGSDDEGHISIELQQHHGRGVRKSPGKDVCNVVVPLPPVGRATPIRNRILRMLRDLMEQTGVLTNMITVLETGGNITAGTLRDHNVHIHPSTTMAVEELTEAVRYTVMEYVEEFNAPLYRRLKETEFDDMVNDILN